MKFLRDLFDAIGKLLIKLAGSRRSFFQLVSKTLTIYLILSLKDGWQIITVFGISTIADFVYFNEINFDKVQTNVNIGNK
jgi:hypothetical protein